MTAKKEFTYVREFELCDRNHFWIVKGISILAAIIAYFCKTYLDFPYLDPLQSIAAAVFVMCSGYGLSESFMKKRGLVHFWENKMIKVWLPSLAVLIVFSYINRGNIIVWIAQSPLGLKGNMLYLIFGAYLAFWLVFRLFEKKALRIGGLFVISAIAFAFVSEQQVIKSLIFGFPVGVMFSQLGWKRSVKQYTWKGKLLLLTASLVLFAVTWFLGNRFSIPYLTTVLLGLAYMSAAVLLCFGVYFAQQLPIFGVFVPVGMMSYALYLLYDNIFLLLKGRTDWRTVALVAVLLILIAAAVTWLREMLINWNRNLRRRRNTHIKGSMW